MKPNSKNTARVESEGYMGADAWIHFQGESKSFPQSDNVCVDMANYVQSLKPQCQFVLDEEIDENPMSVDEYIELQMLPSEF